jgi:hypothetical protein
MEKPLRTPVTKMTSSKLHKLKMKCKRSPTKCPPQIPQLYLPQQKMTNYQKGLPIIQFLHNTTPTYTSSMKEKTKKDLCTGIMTIGFPPWKDKYCCSNPSEYYIKDD